MTGGILVGGGYTKLNLYVEVIAALTNVSLNIILIPQYGIIGAAVGTSMSYFVRNFTSLAFVYKKTKMHPYKKNYIKIVLSGLVVVIFFYILKFQFHLSSAKWFYLIPFGMVFLLVYLSLILFSRCLDKNDLFILKLFIKKLGLKIKLLDRILNK
jgi:O-antigen/teichoic acid export membrane protein